MVLRPKNSKRPQEQSITTGRVDHLPIFAHYLRQLRLVEIVNELVPVQMEVEPGIIVLGAVLDTLSGRSPLYHLEKAFEDYDRELLFGRDIPPGYFNDDNVGRVFDALFAVGTQKIFSKYRRYRRPILICSRGWFIKNHILTVYDQRTTSNWRKGGYGYECNLYRT